MPASTSPSWIPPPVARLGYAARPAAIPQRPPVIRPEFGQIMQSNDNGRPDHEFDPGRIEAGVRRWLERAVIGLNLCPFAKAVYARQQVRIVVSDAGTEGALLEQLGEEMALLRDTPAEDIDTTLLVHPRVLQDFLDYNDFLDTADALVEAMELDGVLQVASFHPHYQFANTDPEDAENLTNRAPYPILHLLREDSVDRAVAAYPEPDAIIERNVATMRELGAEGFRKLLVDDDA
jgi:hypothetical protein